MPDLRFSVSDGREFLAKHDLLGHLTPEELDRLLAPACLEALCEPGGVTLSGDAYRQVRDRLDLAWQDGG